MAPAAGFPADWRIHARAAHAQTGASENDEERIMATDLMTLGVLGMVVLGGWLIDHVGQQAKARLARARKPVQRRQ
jgi:hypothetical protein